MIEQLSLLDEGARLRDDMAVVDLVANDPRVDPKYDEFLTACQNAARSGNEVHVNDVRSLMSNDYGLTIEPRLYSSFWRRASGKKGPLRRLRKEPSTDRRGRNTNKDATVYVWVGAT